MSLVEVARLTLMVLRKISSEEVSGVSICWLCVSSPPCRAGERILATEEPIEAILIFGPSNSLIIALIVVVALSVGASRCLKSRMLLQVVRRVLSVAA